MLKKNRLTINHFQVSASYADITKPPSCKYQWAQIQRLEKRQTIRWSLPWEYKKRGADASLSPARRRAEPSRAERPLFVTAGARRQRERRGCTLAARVWATVNGLVKLWAAFCPWWRHRNNATKWKILNDFISRTSEVVKFYMRTNRCQGFLRQLRFYIYWNFIMIHQIANADRNNRVLITFNFTCQIIDKKDKMLLIGPDDHVPQRTWATFLPTVLRRVRNSSADRIGRWISH